MKVRLYPTQSNAVEIEGAVFSTPEAIERFIRALTIAKTTVWPSQPKKLDDKKA